MRALVLVGVLLGACQDGEYDVVARVTDPDRAARVEVSIVAACRPSEEAGQDPEEPIRTVEAAGADPEPLGSLPPGRYGLYARAWDMDCALWAIGCAQIVVEAGGAGTLQVALHPIVPRGCTAGTRCESQRCVPLDADGGAPRCGDGVASVGEICYSPALAPTIDVAGEAVAADLDHDGRLDVVAAIGGEEPGRGLSITIGRGNDEFDPPAVIFGPSVPNAGPAELALGDVDADGWVDAVVSTSEGQPPLLSLGRETDPHFEAMSPIGRAGSDAHGLGPILADLDADGDLDLVSRGTDAVWVALGNGDGTFAPVGSFGVSSLTAAAVGQLDGDGELEVVVGNADGQIIALDWNLTEIGRGTVDPEIQTLTVTDLDGAPPDEVVAGTAIAVDTLHLDGTTLVRGSPTDVAPGSAVSTAALRLPDGRHAVAALVDEGRRADDVLPTVVVLVPAAGGDLEVHSRERLYCWNGRVTTADLEGDGADEMLVACDPFGVAIVRTDGPGGELYRPVRGPFTYGVVVGDLDGDASPDAILTNWSLTLVRRANEPNAGDFPEAVVGSDGGQDDPTFADFTGDERDDLTSFCVEVDPWCLDGALNRWTANASGAIEELPAIQLPALPKRLTVAHLSIGDRARIVVGLEDGSLVVVNGDTGAFEATAAGLPTDPRLLSAGPLDDVAGDDVVAVGADGTTVVFRSDGAGGLRDAEQLETTQDALALVIADLDGDGMAEIVLTRRGDTNVTVGRLGPGGTQSASTFAAGAAPEVASAVDVDGDGLPELLLASHEAIEVWSLTAEPHLRKTIVGFLGPAGPIFGWPRQVEGDAWEPPWLLMAARPDVGELDWQAHLMAIPPHP